MNKDAGGNWRMVYPDIVEQYSEEFWNAVETMDYQPKQAEKTLKRIISLTGSAHMDAILHLGFLLNDTKRKIEGNALICKANGIALEAIPESFNSRRDKIHWGFYENRPLLRTFHAVGVEYMQEGRYEKAIATFDFMLRVNPSDNPGVRYLLPQCYLNLSKYLEFLALDKKLRETASPEFVFACVLAHYRLGEMDRAKYRWQKAKEKFPYVAQEVASTTHVLPKDEFERSFRGLATVGSRLQAYYYWEDTRELWENDKALKRFLQEN
ncbi:hypothetical protein V9K67_22290 [Paraflavisolibacter sp. H34]|uniref:tetratricopeptide repeat protein n=1 Tax=Huijunlia imazamoxiresistens TaxID=3127457 RepID=UPI003016336B